MLNFDYITKEDIEDYNTNWLHIPTTHTKYYKLYDLGRKNQMH